MCLWLIVLYGSATLKNIHSQCVCWSLLFEHLVSIFVGWTAGRLFRWLFSYIVFGGFFLVGLFWFIVVLVECSIDRTTTISLLGCKEQQSSADHKGCQPGVSGHRKFETLPFVYGHCSVATAPTHTLFRNLSKCDMFPLLKWQINDSTRYLGVTARWKKSINFFSMYYTLSIQLM